MQLILYSNLKHDSTHQIIALQHYSTEQYASNQIINHSSELKTFKPEIGSRTMKESE